jgi:hypothetical protein
VWKKSTYALQRLNLSQSSAIGDVSLEHVNSGHVEKTNPLMKRFRVGFDKISVSVKADPPSLKQPGVECNSHVWPANQVVFCFFFILTLSQAQINIRNYI